MKTIGSTPIADLAIRARRLAAEQVALAEELEELTRLEQAAPARLVEPHLLTVEEAAVALGIGRTTAWDLVSSGGLRSVLIHRLRRVPRQAVDEYVVSLLEESA